MADEVRKRSPALDDMAEEWALVTALLGGTRAMRKEKHKHLPQWPNEEDEIYERRLRTATLFPAFKRTVEILAAKPFSKPLTIGEDMPSRIKAWAADDIDQQGRSLHVFAADVCEDQVSYGLCGILVDYPEVEPGTIKTQADEEAAGVRPYFVHIRAEQLLGCRAEQKNGMWTPTMVRFVEFITEPDGEFGEKCIEQVRVLEPGKWRTYRKQEKPDAAGNLWQLYKEGTTTLPKVPFVPCYGDRVAYMASRAPLIAVAYLNVEHWQSKSDQQTILHVARVPLLFLRCMGDSGVTIGSSAAIKSDDLNADAKYVEHEGKAIDAGEKSLEGLEDLMRQAGAELLVIASGNKSVPQTLADNEQGKCALQRITEDLEDAIEMALQLMAEWVGEKTGGHVTLFKDFGAATLAEASGELLLKMATAGKLSDETLFDEVKRRGAISPELDWKAEKTKIDEQPPPLGGLGLDNPDQPNAPPITVPKVPPGDGGT